MGFIKGIIEIFFHLDKHLDLVIKTFGNYSYLLFFLIVFAETGLVVTPFLPGDSLLFATGAFAAIGYFNIFWLFTILVGAAIIGDSVNYFLGQLFGEKILEKNHRLFNKEHVERTHKFYEKYGGKTIILARFVPVIRTFAPFVAGVGRMNYFKFIIYNITGGLLWVCLFVLGGYYFGNIPFIKNNFSFTILVIVVLSVLPVVIEFWKHRSRNKL
jgi:membrane-associated protein